VIYEASFLAGGVFVSVDILERKRNGYVLVEVKATLDVKEEHFRTWRSASHLATSGPSSDARGGDAPEPRLSPS
jgi:hypothetical protein